MKCMLTEAPALAFYNSAKPVVISADASSYGLRAIIFQQFGDELKPIAFASGALTSAESKYAQMPCIKWRQNFVSIMDSVEEYARRWTKSEGEELDTLMDQKYSEIIKIPYSSFIG